MMIVYSFLLIVGVVISSPWWLWRMAASGRYREGLAGRLVGVPRGLQEAVAAATGVVWVHAVSVGEVLAVERLVDELGERLGAGWVVVVSTTTATGHQVARERFGVGRVFYFPLDFGWAVRRYLRVLKPRLMALVESELWPRLLWECERSGVPVAVVNARVSDRSYRRTMRVRELWGWMARRVTLWLAQGEETAGRLRQLGVEAGRVRVMGNLKFDLREVQENAIARHVKRIAGGSPIIVAGSTADRKNDSVLSEDEMVIQAWEGRLRRNRGVLLVLAPRHPQRCVEVEAVAMEFRLRKASELTDADGVDKTEIVLLDSVGNLAAVYGCASVAFVGGSLVGKGGQNPLEAARFGVPVVIGPSYENFREIVEGMREASAIRIVDKEGLEEALTELLQDDGGMGERGRIFYERQTGATKRTVDALVELIRA